MWEGASIFPVQLLRVRTSPPCRHKKKKSKRKLGELRSVRSAWIADVCSATHNLLRSDPGTTERHGGRLGPGFSCVFLFSFQETFPKSTTPTLPLVHQFPHTVKLIYGVSQLSLADMGETKHFQDMRLSPSFSSS